MADLQNATKKSFKPHPDVIVVKAVHDFKKWMEPHVPNIHDHLKAHAFKFIKKNGVTLMYYKDWTTDKYWLPESGLALLTVNEETQLVCPSTTPDLVSPHCDNLDKLESTLARISAYLLKDGAKEWWRNWIQDVRKENEKEPLSMDSEYEGILQLRTLYNVCNSHYSIFHFKNHCLTILHPPQMQKQ